MSQAQLHAAFMDLLFEPGGEAAFAADPAGFAAARGLGGPDQAAFGRYAKRFGVYRALVKGSLLDPLPDCFPILKTLLEAAGQWEACQEAFLQSRSVQSLYYRDVAPTFLAWLADTAWGQDRWPCLLQLAHWEYVELDCLLHPDTVPVSGLGKDPSAMGVAHFDGAFRNLAYGFRVQEADEEDPEPAPGTACLLALRNREGRFEWQEVDGPTSAFLARALEGQPLGEAAAAVALPWDTAAELLMDLQERGGVLGFEG